MVHVDIDLNFIGIHVTQPLLMREGVPKEVRWNVVILTHQYNLLTSQTYLCAR